MSLGLGIFLSTVVVSILLLYRWTRERWNWGKGLKRVALWFSAICVVLGFSFWGYNTWEQRPRVVTSLQGIAIGEKLSDVVFNHGAFERKKRDPDSVRKYQDTEDYEQKDKVLRISVRSGIVVSVDYGCKSEFDYASLNRISCDDSGDKIKELFGSKVRVLCSKKVDENSRFFRVYDVSEYGTRYYVWRNKVKALLIANKEELESWVGLNWDKCD